MRSVTIRHLYGDDADVVDAAFFCQGEGSTQVAIVTDGVTDLSVYCDGTMEVRDFATGAVYRTAGELLEAGFRTDYGLSEAERVGQIEFVYNPWFELYDRNGDSIDGSLAQTYDDAINFAKELLTKKEAR